MTSSRSRFDPLPPDKGALDRGAMAKNPQTGGGTHSTMAEEAGQPDGIDLLHIIGAAEKISKDYQSKTVERPLARAYRAWQNQHAEGSKYLGTAWKGRSRLFVPKTRSAVRKNLATAAGALFSTEDVVSIAATFEDDDQQRATAAVIKADLDFRLTRSSTKSGIPWFQIAMGGCMDGQLTGCTISKQFWEYEEVETDDMEPALVPVLDEETGEPVMELAVDEKTGEYVLDPETGEPQIVPLMVEGEVPKMRVTKDRPMVELIPIENVGIDPAAPWYDPAQLGRWLYVRYPMGLSDVRAMMKSGAKPGAMGHDPGWLEDVPDELLLKGRIEEDRSGGRRVREGGGDRYVDAKSPGDLDIVWIQENFVRVGGQDWHFWSVGRHGYISRVRPTYKAYPELEGERPYVFGVSNLDTHRVFPMSPVDSWQPLQLELNDITNLRQDTLKRSIAPLAVVKRGKNVDLTQVQRRGQPDAMLLVDNPGEDVIFQQTPGPTGAAFTETSINNAMFDELAGVFSTSSVQSNRQLNETVGGMRIMSGAANAVSEFDLRIWVETWVERVLRQLVHLVRYNESDEKILALAGQRSRVWTRFQYMPNLSDFEQCELTLRVNCGIGALDPMQRLAKLKMAGEMLAPMMPFMQQEGITPNVEAFIEEVMGHAGFRDGRRFFKFGDKPQEQGPPPEVQMAMEELKTKNKAIDARLAETQMKIKSEEARNHEDNQTQLQIAAMREKGSVLNAAVDVHKAREARGHDAKMAGENRQQRIRELVAGRAFKEQDRQQAASAAAPPSAPAPADASQRAPDDRMSQMLMQVLDQMNQRQNALENVLKALVQQMGGGMPRSPMGTLPGAPMPGAMGNLQPA